MLEALFLCSDRVPWVVVLLVVLRSILGRLVGGCFAQWCLIIELLVIEDLWVLGITMGVNRSMVNQFMECWGVMLVLFVDYHVMLMVLSCVDDRAVVGCCLVAVW